MHVVLVNHLRGLSLLRKSVVRLIDRPDKTSAVKQQYTTEKKKKINDSFRIEETEK